MVILILQSGCTVLEVLIFMLLMIWHSEKVVGMVTLILQNCCTVLSFDIHTYYDWAFRMSCQNGHIDIAKSVLEVLIFMLFIITRLIRVVKMVKLILRSGCTVLGVLIFMPIMTPCCKHGWGAARPLSPTRFCFFPIPSSSSPRSDCDAEKKNL